MLFAERVSSHTRVYVSAALNYYIRNWLSALIHIIIMNRAIFAIGRNVL
jgi:hypothetical protein